MGSLRNSMLVLGEHLRGECVNTAHWSFTVATGIALVQSQPKKHHGDTEALRNTEKKQSHNQKMINRRGRKGRRGRKTKTSRRIHGWHSRLQYVN